MDLGFIIDLANPMARQVRRGDEIYKCHSMATGKTKTGDIIGGGMQSKPLTFDVAGTSSSPPPTQSVPPCLPLQERCRLAL